MTVPQADGTIEVTLHGPTLQTVALRGPACAVNKRKRRRKRNTKKRPKRGSTARKKHLRANIKSLIFQTVKSQCLQVQNPEDPVLYLILLQVSIIHRDRDVGLLPHTHDRTQNPTHPADPDLEGDPCLILGPEAFLDQEVVPCLDLDQGLHLILDPGQDQDAGTDPDR